MLHRALGVHEGAKIPTGMLTAAAKSGTPHMRSMAQFALNAKKFKH